MPTIARDEGIYSLEDLIPSLVWTGAWKLADPLRLPVRKEMPVLELHCVRTNSAKDDVSGGVLIFTVLGKC